MKKNILKEKIYNLFEKPFLEKYGYVFNIILIIIITINILSFTLPSVLLISEKTKLYFKLIEKITIYLFIIELLLRYYSIGIDKKYKGIFGKIKYTFKIYTLIDILIIISYILFESHLIFFRILRIFKLLRFKKTIKKYFNICYFAKLNLINQILVLIILSIIIISFFSLIFNSIKLSTLIFIDPPGITELNGYLHISAGIIELIFGLLIGGALISIITEFLNTIVNNINKGYHPYKGRQHFVIINYNPKLEIILEELNIYYKNIKNEQDIVLFLPKTDIENFKNNLPNYSNLNIHLITGDIYHKNSYKRINIAYANKIIILNDKKTNIIKLIKFIESENNFIDKDMKFIIELTDAYNKETFSEILNKFNYILIFSEKIIKTIIKRSIIDYNYFNILLEIISFNGYKFYIKEASEYINKPTAFSEIFNNFEKGILIGIIKNNNPIINPHKNSIINPNDKFIMLLENSSNYIFINKKNFNIVKDRIYLKQPNLKENKKVAIIGNNYNIKKSDLTDFLTIESINQIQIIKNENYYNNKFWINLNNKFDIIILNLEDEFEFNLTLYLKSIFKNTDLLDKIVNIFNEPLAAKLLSDKNKKIILSQEIVAKYITQNIFNDYIEHIYFELTHSIGNELYILKKEDYTELFMYNFLEFKNILLKNNMIYIGAFFNNKFIFEFNELNKIEEFVVLAKGKE